MNLINNILGTALLIFSVLKSYGVHPPPVFGGIQLTDYLIPLAILGMISSYIFYAPLKPTNGDKESTRTLGMMGFIFCTITILLELFTILDIYLGTKNVVIF